MEREYDIIKESMYILCGKHNDLLDSVESVVEFDSEDYEGWKNTMIDLGIYDIYTGRVSVARWIPSDFKC